MRCVHVICVVAVILAVCVPAPTAEFRKRVFNNVITPKAARVTVEEGPAAFGRPRVTVFKVERHEDRSKRIAGPVGKGLDLRPKVKRTFGPGVVLLGKKGFVSGVGADWKLKGN